MQNLCQRPLTIKKFYSSHNVLCNLSHRTKILNILVSAVKNAIFSMVGAEEVEGFLVREFLVNWYVNSSKILGSRTEFEYAHHREYGRCENREECNVPSKIRRSKTLEIPEQQRSLASVHLF